MQGVRRPDAGAEEEDEDVGALRDSEHDGVAVAPDPVSPRVPSLLELLRPSVKRVLVPRAVNPWGWKHYDGKLVSDREPYDAV